MPAFVLSGNSQLNQTKNVFLCFFVLIGGPVAQLVEHRPFKAIVASSSLARLTSF
jgi:hypothetical protein